MLWAILASCAFDPRHPNAPCNDTPMTPFWVPVLWGFTVLAVIVSVALVVKLVYRKRRTI